MCITFVYSTMYYVYICSEFIYIYIGIWGAAIEAEKKRLALKGVTHDSVSHERAAHYLLVFKERAIEYSVTQTQRGSLLAGQH